MTLTYLGRVVIGAGRSSSLTASRYDSTG